MRALTFHAPLDLRVETVPDPRILSATDVVVRVTLGAICGSDLHIYRGHEAGLDTGTVMGHEFLGEVVEVGGEVERWRAGDLVVSPFTTSCGACRACACGLTARCEKGELFGWVEDGRGLHGAQGEYVRVPLADSTLVEAPRDLPGEAVLFSGDVLSTGFSCAGAAHIEAGDAVVVLGCGPVGLCAAIAAREGKAGRVLAVDSVPERLRLAERYGATPLDFAAQDVVHAVRAETAGYGADRVLEAVGSPETTRLAYEMVRPGGTISAAGVHTEPHLAFSPGEAYDRNLTYSAGRASARAHMQRSLEIIRAGNYDLTAIVSHRLPLDEAPRGYDLFDRKLEGCTKVLLEP